MNRTIRIESGLIRGIAGGNPSTTVFKGVPFAKPPVGELRWRPPVAPDPWSGVLDCARFRHFCTQIPLPQGSLYQKEFFPVSFESSEDCLYLSVWTPSAGFDPEDRLPVMVWFHGGAYVQGSDHEPEFDGEAFCRNGVILVTVPYRLGVFGYLAHPELTQECGHSGNYGLLDQIFALRWIRRNIACFGGNPDNVTIFGQSAGGGSVQAICASPLARGLFHKAIIQSADAIQPLGRVLPLSEAERFGTGLTAHLGQSIDQLRAMPDQILLHAAADYVDLCEKRSPEGLRFRPCVDGFALPVAPNECFVDGSVGDIPFMMGSVLGDVMLFGASTSDGLESFRSALISRYGEADADDLLSALDIHDNAGLDAVAGLLPQAFAMAPSVAFAKNRNRLGHTPAYIYHFDRQMPGEDRPGAFHSSELWYVFGTVCRCWRPMTGRDYDLALAMNRCWCSFAKSGDPNGRGLPFWPAYTQDSPSWMHFDEAEQGDHTVAENRLLDALADFIVCRSARK